jgi:beta-lactamase regulating signal transducer with metallopeptidase domain
LLQAVFWINPLFIFLKKAVQLNHEFLADENVIHKHRNTFQYQHLLLNKATLKKRTEKNNAPAPPIPKSLKKE